jgi:peptidoglycan/LPS O-acetylase OafA/YrhL
VTALVEHGTPWGAPIANVSAMDDSSPDRDSSEWRHLPSLDGLRAVAVTAVLLFHAGYLSGGFLGVDLFFVLSGFLITSLLIRDASTRSESGGRIHLTSFWGRRFRRLLPAVLTMIVLVALWAWLFGSGADLASVKSDGPASVLYFANWHFIASSAGYWQSFAQPSMFGHLWSLAIEEQFYLLWPVVLVAIWAWSKRPARTLTVVCVVGITASAVSMLLLYHGGEPTRVYMGTDTRAASLLVGALAATPLARRFAGRAAAGLGSAVDVIVAALLVALLAAWVSLDGATSQVLYRGGLLAHSMLCAIVVALIVAADRGVLVRGLSWRPLVWIGTLSYGIYLWHWPIFVALSPERVDLDGPPLAVVRIGLSVVAAWLSYRIIENPIRRRATWATGWTGISALVVAVSAALILVVVVPKPPVIIAGFDASALSPRPAAVPQRPATSPQRAENASVAPSSAAVPTPSAPLTSAAPVVLPPVSTVLWAGDSVAYDIAPAMKASLQAGGWTVDDLAAYPGFMLMAPQRKNNLVEWINKRVAISHPQLVILQTSNWDEADDPAAYADTLRGLAAQLGARGARLLVIPAPPTGDAPFSAAVAKKFDIAAELAALEPTGNLSVIDSRAVWGPPGVLDIDGDGTPERKRDLMHVCPSGAAKFTAWMTDELARRFGGLTPADPAQWASQLWVVDKRYDQPVGACAPVG